MFDDQNLRLDCVVCVDLCVSQIRFSGMNRSLKCHRHAFISSVSHQYSEIALLNAFRSWTDAAYYRHSLSGIVNVWWIFSLLKQPDVNIRTRSLTRVYSDCILLCSLSRRCLALPHKLTYLATHKKKMILFSVSTFLLLWTCYKVFVSHNTFLVDTVELCCEHWHSMWHGRCFNSKKSEPQKNALIMILEKKNCLYWKQHELLPVCSPSCR